MQDYVRTMTSLSDQVKPEVAQVKFYNYKLLQFVNGMFYKVELLLDYQYEKDRHSSSTSESEHKSKNTKRL
jgi:hypothetical protein